MYVVLFRYAVSRVNHNLTEVKDQLIRFTFCIFVHVISDVIEQVLKRQVKCDLLLENKNALHDAVTSKPYKWANHPSLLLCTTYCFSCLEVWTPKWFNRLGKYLIGTYIIIICLLLNNMLWYDMNIKLIIKV